MVPIHDYMCLFPMDIPLLARVADLPFERLCGFCRYFLARIHLVDEHRLE
jgi:hypothetical protein